jgi:predicted lysophospholipase L1 biosynthesis ABC-type transport system permease subunit
MSTSPKAAVVNDSFAKYFFGTAPALGRHVTSAGIVYEIVGVVADAKYQNLRDPILKTIYISWMQREGDQPSSYRYLMRAGGDSARLISGLDRLVREVDPGLRVRRVATWAAIVGRSIGTERIMATLGGLFGVLALLLAGLGMFGTLAFQVARRTNELGVRMALGASRWSVVRLVLRDVAVMIVPGVAIGAGLALMLTGLARGMLFGLAPREPGVFVIAATVLASAAVVAAWLPACRASGVDPVVALRHE